MKKLIHTLDPALLAEGTNDDRYNDSPFRNLKKLPPKTKGSRFEKITRALMEAHGHSYEKRTGTDNDAVFDDISYEIKGGLLCQGKDTFAFLQIRPDQIYDGIIFSMFYPHHVIFMTMDKSTVLSNISSGVFKKQHGGTKADSRTYYYSGNEITLAEIGARMLHEIE
jgi:hypothetical protein